MFSTLLESKRKRQRSAGSTFMSAILHVLLVTGAVYATAKANEPEETRDEAPTYTIIKPNETPPPKPIDTPPPADEPPRQKGFQTLTAPINIPTVLPIIDLTQQVTNPDDYYKTVGVSGGFFNGDPARTKVNPDSTFHIYDVDKVARLADGNPEPNYPAILKQTKQTGKVRVRFVIDTAGRADMSTLEIVESTHSMFADEVKKVLPKYRFIPAKIGETKVRMSVELPFEFRLDPRGEHRSRLD